MSAFQMALQSLFNDEALETAARHDSASRFRWLALGDDPEAVALRAGLERGFALAGDSADVLRKGLMHERWGQHAGALAHLLALGMLARQGWAVASEPHLGGQAPDILATRADGGRSDGARMLVEVRSITGAGNFPWEVRRAPRSPGRATPAQREAEARAAAQAADALVEAVDGVLERKAERYATLVQQLALPFVICLYEDKDDQIAPAAARVVFGRDGALDGGAFAGRFGGRPGGSLGSSSVGVAGSPSGGAGDGLADVSAVLVFGRLDTNDGALLLRGSVLPNPAARRPLLEDAFPLLAGMRAVRGRMVFAAPAQPFALTD